MLVCKLPLCPIPHSKNKEVSAGTYYNTNCHFLSLNFLKLFFFHFACIFSTFYKSFPPFKTHFPLLIKNSPSFGYHFKSTNTRPPPPSHESGNW